MLSVEEQIRIKEEAVKLLKKNGIVLTKKEEQNSLKIAEYEGVDFYRMGLVLATIVNNKNYCGRLILFFPNQFCAEHWHPDVNGKPGKQETFRVLSGKVYAYVQGENSQHCFIDIPPDQEEFFTSRHEIILNPGDQYTLDLHEKHWFAAGEDGAIALEISTHAQDDYDLLTNDSLKIVLH